MRAASSSRCCQSCSRQAKKTSLRAMRGVSRQAGKAAAAAATAASTSGAPPRGTRAMTAPVAGLYTGPVCSGRTSTGAPAIQWDRMGRLTGAALASGRTSVVMVLVPPWGCGRTRGHDGQPAWIGQTRLASCSTDRRHYGAHRARSGRRLPSLPDGPSGAAARPGGWGAVGTRTIGLHPVVTVRAPSLARERRAAPARRLVSFGPLAACPSRAVMTATPQRDHADGPRRPVRRTS